MTRRRHRVARVLWHLGRRCRWCRSLMSPRWWAVLYCCASCKEERRRDLGCGHGPHRTAADAWPCYARKYCGYGP